MTRYKCLVLDHDDTVVRSTPEINYPSFVETLAVLRPGVSYSYEEFLTLCAEPGFEPLCRELLAFDDAEMELETQMWLAWVRRVTPSFWPGMAELCRHQKAEGGLVCVASHSFDENIRRDYQAGCPGLILDGVYGWDHPGGRKKPDPWPLEDIMARFNLNPRDILMVDDLKPGLQMARAAGVDFACAGWSHNVPAVRDMMRAQSPRYLQQVAELDALLFGP